jgi:hypothetical protein
MNKYQTGYLYFGEISMSQAINIELKGAMKKKEKLTKSL